MPPLVRSATGTMGLTADLTAGEIVEQLVHANRVSRIRNIVFMVGLGGFCAPFAELSLDREGCLAAKVVLAPALPARLLQQRPAAASVPG